jgi:hypothetical protein
VCRVSCVVCRVSCVVCRVSCVVCRVSCVVCRVSCVVCRVSCRTGSRDAGMYGAQAAGDGPRIPGKVAVVALRLAGPRPRDLGLALARVGRPREADRRRIHVHRPAVSATVAAELLDQSGQLGHGLLHTAHMSHVTCCHISKTACVAFLGAGAYEKGGSGGGVLVPAGLEEVDELARPSARR